MKLHDKIVNCIYKSYSTLPFFYELLQYTYFEENDNIPTAGTYTTLKGFKIEYNKEFVDNMSEPFVMFILIHELLHNLYNHQERTKDRDKKRSNIVKDMIINSIIEEDVFNSFKHDTTIDLSKLLELPKKVSDNKDDFVGYYIPEEFIKEGISQTFENLYEWMNKKSDERKEQNKKDGTENKPHKGLGNVTNQYIDNFDNSDDCQCVDIHDFLNDDSISDSIKKQVVDDILAKVKERGIASNMGESILKKLRPKHHNWFNQFKSDFSFISGSKKYNTWNRPNRKDLPVKGYKKVNTEINVILDTSGSMYNSFEKVLNHIVGQDYVMNIVQCDTKVNNVTKVDNKSKIQKLKIHGLGGTILQPAVTYIKDDKRLKSLPTVLLTDGECDDLDLMGLRNNFMILTTSQKVKVSNSIKKVKQILITE